MAKLYFNYSTMNAGKSTLLLQAAHNYREGGMQTYLITAQMDNRAGMGRIASRIGIGEPADTFANGEDMFAKIAARQTIGPIACVFIDEAQFLSKDQVWQLARAVDDLGVPVMTYGLRVDFQGNLFPGSAALLAWADEMREVRTICHCGKKGCLETEASGIALLRKFKERIQAGSTSLAFDGTRAIETITLQNIIEAAKNEDTLCIEILEELGEKLGKAIAIVINIFNPETVILGGTLSETGEYLRFSAKSTLNRLSHSIVNNDTTLKVSQLGEKAGVLGACLNARAKYLFDQ